jgi:hypothetical protein
MVYFFCTDAIGEGISMHTPQISIQRLREFSPIDFLTEHSCNNYTTACSTLSTNPAA